MHHKESPCDYAEFLKPLLNEDLCQNGLFCVLQIQMRILIDHKIKAGLSRQFMHLNYLFGQKFCENLSDFKKTDGKFM
jgi:hypothetical protein